MIPPPLRERARQPRARHPRAQLAAWQQRQRRPRRPRRLWPRGRTWAQQLPEAPQLPTTTAPQQQQQPTTAPQRAPSLKAYPRGRPQRMWTLVWPQAPQRDAPGGSRQKLPPRPPQFAWRRAGRRLSTDSTGSQTSSGSPRSWRGVGRVARETGAFTFTDGTENGSTKSPQWIARRRRQRLTGDGLKNLRSQESRLHVVLYPD
jgi:hypothetical protein